MFIRVQGKLKILKKKKKKNQVYTHRILPKNSQMMVSASFLIFSKGNRCHIYAFWREKEIDIFFTMVFWNLLCLVNVYFTQFDSGVFENEKFKRIV